MMKLDENSYKTSDLTLAATLSLHFPIISIDRSSSRKVFFVFYRSSELDQYIERFWRSEITIEPQIFANQVKNLKTRLYSGE